MKDELAKIGIKDQSFDFLTVRQLIDRGVLDKPLDGNHGEIHPKGEDFVETGVPFIMASDINNGVADYKNCKFISSKQADSLRKGFAKNGDVLLTHKATIGRTAVVNYDKHPYVMLTPQVTYYRIRDSRKLNNRYLRFYFESSFFQNILNLWAGSGSTRAYLGITDQERLPVIFPPLCKQRKIAAVLSAHDDLIQNNRRRIALLEKMAEEIYHEWFVRLRFPGYKQAKFNKGLPEGWELMPFSELAEINPAERPEKGEDKPYVGMEDLSTSSMYFVPKEKRKGNSGSRFKNGDTLFPRITPCLENGKRGFVMTLEESEIAIGSTEFIVMREKVLTAEYIYLLSCFEPFRKHAEISMVGASGRQRVNEGCFSFFFVKLPPKKILDSFSKIIKPIFEEVRLLNEKNNRLTEARDLALPRLISGKLSVESLDIQFPPSMEDTA